jgi:hypothetical protein
MAAESETLQQISYVDLRSKLNCARQMDVGALSAEEVAERIRSSVMAGYWTNLIRAEITGLYRARKNNGIDPWLSIEKLWYPPASKIDKRGRFNEIGKSVFYACDTFAGAITEVRPKIGDLITVLVVRGRDELVALDNAQIGLERLRATGFGKKGSHVLRRYGAFQAILKERGIMKKWLLLDNFLSEMATSSFSPESEQDKYKITNAVSNAQRFCGTSCVSQRGTQTSHLPGQSLRPEFAKRPLTNRSAGAHASAGSSAGRVHSVLIAGLRICGFRFSHWAIAKRIFEVTDSTKNDFPELSQAYNQTRKPCRQR